MEEIIENYHHLFPYILGTDWGFALLGLLFHVVLKLKAVWGQKREFKKRVEHFFIVWLLCFIAVFISFELIPEQTKHFDYWEAITLAYSYSSLFYNLFKKIYQ